MSWQAPTIGTRPVAVLGGGVLGRRIACSYAAGGYNVTIQDPSAEARADATDFINSKKEEFATYTKHPTQGQFGSFSAYEDIESAVREAWLVIEAVPEKLELKIDVFELLDNCAPKDCVLGSNSSSYRTSLMLDRVSADRRKLICNIHYTMPMDIRTVELMTDGETEEAIFPFLTTVLERCGMLPATARKESTGCVFISRHLSFYCTSDH